jgi:hypothetical protein
VIDLTHPLVLTYASPALSGRRKPNWLEWARLALLSPALLVPFVSFTWGTSPLAALEEFPSVAKSEWIFILLGGGFFVGFPLFAWRLRNLLPGVPRRWELLVGWFVAFFSVLIPTAMLLDLTLSTGPADLDRIELFMLRCDGHPGFGNLAQRSRPDRPPNCPERPAFFRLSCQRLGLPHRVPRQPGNGVLAYSSGRVGSPAGTRRSQHPLAQRFTAIKPLAGADLTANFISVPRARAV